MKRRFALLLSVLLLLTAVPSVSADITYNDDQLDWDGMYNPDDPCTHRTRTHYEAVASTCAVAGYGAYAVCNDCGVLLEGSDAALPLAEHVYDHEYDPDCNGCGSLREVGEVPADYNLIQGGDFEDFNTSSKHWNTDNAAYAVFDGTGHASRYGLKFDGTVKQSGIRLQPDTDYVLTFWKMFAGTITVTVLAEDSSVLWQEVTPKSEGWMQFGGVFHSGEHTVVTVLFRGAGHIDDIVLVQTSACAHVYDTACDTACNWCGTVRKITHAYEAEVDQAAGCGRDGQMRYTCTVCGDSYTETIPATGEHWGDGYPCRDQYCSGCGTFLPATEDHVYEVAGNGDATCGEDGWVDYRCVHCFDSYTVTIPATGEHIYDYACDEYCNECGDWREVTNHNYVAGREIAPGCVTDGVREYVCTACMQFYMETLPATGEHVYDDEYDFDCNDCGFIRDVTIRGDANGDGRVNNHDLACLQYYINERPVSINIHAVDMDGNGRLNNRDLGLMQRYLNGW